ncbi:hypothetical protein DFA_00487 [Cavenderia fasciculata]|uniref:Uncharacterized protein n=1 Tax=Cavenderia fasciculata TaxID=261658 RepID=F4PS28_CACFS|nr:uncharacterized protein DFA_00487 [Cavenderia fasciculata]EGG20626.1 hypothetical protein DFA_00487 [Cavenderia fasciculata]|eukprot:XP_004358476.1 hypothetical protein DFA_00487 [Cavenderia fasciculata]
MEQPSDDFIEVVVMLAREDQQKQKKNNKVDDNNVNYKSTKQQLFKEYSLDRSKVVSWLLYLMVKGTYPTIKDKEVQLLDILLIKDDLIRSLSQPLLDILKVETIELLNTTLTDSFKCHLFGILESLSNYLIPIGCWNELKGSLELILERGEEEEESPLKANVKRLLVLLSQFDFELDKQEMLEDLINSNDFVDSLTDEQQKS